ncbi:DUF6817 domain-containing protein [Sphaerisporangium fuscum]|uniref:DUF6817 domain-containing protein n=1 Tax=Sphaerisporangium fuscum TaxID=2835868 RepID=UPI002029A98E|nr:hypothetical protein [Sphaerisporangium fuscum]
MGEGVTVAAGAVIGFLAARGAGEIAHPGGTLLAHLERVHATLDRWGARPALRLAGLCHAFYGTDGFPSALGEVNRREELAALIGEEAEALVYLYGGYDRHHSTMPLGDPGCPFRNRFTGAVLYPPPPLRRDFAEITVANELDLAHVDPGFRAEHGPGLYRLFTSWQDLLSAPARGDVEDLLG